MQSNIKIGYMNVHHQRILAHVGISGDKNIGFVMWCSGVPAKCMWPAIATC
jgi:hypothetical protein